MTKEEAIEVVKEAHDLLSIVPEKDWIIERFITTSGKCCAEGHYNRLSNGLKIDEFTKINDLCADGVLTNAVSVLSYRKFDYALYHVNDYGTLKFNQPTPKQRVLALLEELVPELKHPCHAEPVEASKGVRKGVTHG